MVKSKYSAFQVAAYVVASCLFFFAAYSIYENNPPVFKIYVAIVLISLLGLSLLINYFQKTPRIVFTEDLITIKSLLNTTTYSWEQVQAVSLNSNEIYTYLIFGFPFNAMKLTFDDGKSLLVWTEKYANTRDLRNYVVQKLNRRLHIISDRKVINTNAVFKERKYAGNPMFTNNTLMIVGTIIFFLVMMNVRLETETNLWIPLLILVSVIYILFGIDMYFFELKEDKLLVKNHYFPWLKSQYDLNNIEEVSTEIPSKRSRALRIITYDFESKRFGAGSLRTENWNQLFEDLATLGIKVNK